MTNISVKKHNRKSRKNNRRKGGSTCEGVGLETKSGWFSKYCAPEEEAVKEGKTTEENTKKAKEAGLLSSLFTSSNDIKVPAIDELTITGEAPAPAIDELTITGEAPAPAPEIDGLSPQEVQGQPSTGGKNKKSKKQSKRKTAKKGGNKKQNKSKKNSRKNRSKK
jgi:hypothetical protein